MEFLSINELVDTNNFPLEEEPCYVDKALEIYPYDGSLSDEPSEEEINELVSFAKEMKNTVWREKRLFYSLQEIVDAGLTNEVDVDGLMANILSRSHRTIQRGENCILISRKMWMAIHRRSNHLVLEPREV
jgi:hypothetical protein